MALRKIHWEIWCAVRHPRGGAVWVFVGIRVGDIRLARGYTDLGYLVREAERYDTGSTLPLFPRLGSTYPDPEEWLDQMSVSVSH